MVNNKIEVGKSSFTWSIHLRAVRVVSYTVWSTLHILSTFFGRCVEGSDGRGPLVGMDWKLTGRWPPFGKSSSSCELILSGFGRKIIFVRILLKWNGDWWVLSTWILALAPLTSDSSWSDSPRLVPKKRVCRWHAPVTVYCKNWQFELQEFLAWKSVGKGENIMYRFVFSLFLRPSCDSIKK